MKTLSIKQLHEPGREPTFVGDGWIGIRNYQLEPWPDRCVIIYYDIGPNVQIGQVATFDFDNGRAEYRVVRDINGLNCDFECELLPGSTWELPPAEVMRF